MADDIQLVPVAQLPPDSWFEGITNRPNGWVLAARLDSPELYTFDPSNKEAEPELIYTFDDVSGLVNICAIGDADGHEAYAVIAGRFNLGNLEVQTEHWAVWKVVLGDGAPKVTQIAALPQGGLLLGIAPATPLPAPSRFLLVADSGKNVIWSLDTQTKALTEVFGDEHTMAPASSDEFFGINTLSTTKTHAWWTNTSKGLLCRVPISVTDAGVVATGPVETVADELLNSDGLSVMEDGSAVFTAGYMVGLVWRVDVDKATGKGTVSVLTRGLSSPTTMTLGDGDKKLFVACCGEKEELAWVADDKSLADAFGKVDITVSVQVEEVTHVEQE